MRPRRDGGDVGARSLPRLQLGDDLGKRGNPRAQRLEYRGGARDRVIEHPVHEVLDRPRELAQLARADHASASLERVERAAHGDERVALEGVLVPDGEEVLDPGELFLRLLDEELHQLGVSGLGRCRSPLRGRERRGRGVHGFRVRPPAGRWREAGYLHGTRQGGGFERLDRRHSRGRLLLEGLHAGLGVVQHVPGIRAPRLQRLHVVLDADDGVRQPVDVARRQHVDARLHHALELHGDRLDDLHRARLAEQQQSRLEAAHQVWPAVETGCVQRPADALGDGVLDAREVHDALAQHRRLHLLEFGVLGRPRELRVLRQDHADQAVVELVLDADQGGGDLDQRRLIGLERALDDLP